MNDTWWMMTQIRIQKYFFWRPQDAKDIAGLNLTIKGQNRLRPIEAVGIIWFISQTLECDIHIKYPQPMSIPVRNPSAVGVDILTSVSIIISFLFWSEPLWKILVLSHTKFKLILGRGLMLWKHPIGSLVHVPMWKIGCYCTIDVRGCFTQFEQNHKYLSR
jgi:hypothetical protein